MAFDKAQLISDLTTIFEDLDASNTAASKASEVATAIDDYIADYLENCVALLSVTTVSLAADGDTTLYTVTTGKRCILSHAILVVGADAGTTDISIGQNGAETDFVGTIDLGNLDAQYDACRLAPVPVAAGASAALEKSYSAGTVIEAQVSNHAGGETNTLYLFGTLY